jgi:hypothetical protein
MKRFAAALGLVTACGGTNLAPGPTDGSSPVVDAFRDSDEASSGPSDATTERNDAADAGYAADALLPSGEGGTVTACAGATVPPATLSCTGLYADIATKTLAQGVRSYQPAVPLWSDGAQKARWIELPPGTQIDASDPSEWTFPVGTKVWKEFSSRTDHILGFEQISLGLAGAQGLTLPELVAEGLIAPAPTQTQLSV